MVSSQKSAFSIMPFNPKKRMCKVYKVIVLGDRGVGKSTLLRQMTDSEVLSPNNDDIHNDYVSKMATVEGAPAPVKVQLWDTAGQEKFGAARLPSSFFRHADAALVVYDVSDRKSFVNVLQWVLQTQTYRDSGFPLILVGHKSEVSNASRQVEEDEGQKYAKLIGACHFFECSSRDGTNIQACFDAVATALVRSEQTSDSMAKTQGQLTPNNVSLLKALLELSSSSAARIP